MRSLVRLLSVLFAVAFVAGSTVRADTIVLAPGDSVTVIAAPCDEEQPPLPGLGACCASDGTCTSTIEAVCAGTWRGPGTSCNPNPCLQPQPPPTGECRGCHANNSECVESGFWAGWCVDEVENFRSSGTEGQMTHNANCLHYTPRIDKRTIRWKWDVKFASSWITNCVARGQHLGSAWAAYAGGNNRIDWAKRNVRVDFSRQCLDGFDVVIQGYKNDSGTDAINLIMDTRLNTRVPGAYRANEWRTTIVTATYDPGEGRVYGTVEYVGAGIKSFSHTDSDAKDFPVGWSDYGYGNIDDEASGGSPRSDFGVTVRNVSVEVF